MELRLSDVQHAGLRIDIAQGQPQQLPKAQTRGVEQHQCHAHNRGAQRRARSRRQGRSELQHPGDLVWLDEAWQCMGDWACKRGRVGQETVRLRAAPVATEAVHDALIGMARVGVEPAKRAAPVVEQSLIELDSASSGQKSTQPAQHPFFLLTASAKRAAVRQIGVNGGIYTG